MQPNWFIALKAPEDLELNSLLKSKPQKLRVFSPTDRHITLAFLGHCSSEDAHAAWQIALQSPPFIQNLQPQALQTMGNPKRPSAAALTFRHADSLATWMSVHRPALLAAAKRPAAQYPPLPHMTIARPKRRANHLDRQTMIEWCDQANVDLPSIVFDKMALCTWSKDRKKALFQTVIEYNLSYGCTEINCTGHNHEWERCTTNGF